MARFIAIGDVHEQPGPRNADRLAALDQIISEGRLHDLGAWIVAGDLFHTKSTSEGRNAWDTRLQRMAACAPVLIVYGNHDEKGDLDGFARLSAAWPIVVVDQPRVIELALATGEGAAIFALPYPHKGGLVGAGVAPGDVVATGGDLLDPIFITAAAELAQCRSHDMLTCMVGHANIVGAIASTGQPQWGREIDVTKGHLDRLGPICKLFGHIHKPQEVSGAHYIGSVCRLDYGEIEEKRYIVADIGFDSTYTLESHQIAIAPMYHVAATLDVAHGFQFIERPPASWEGADVRCRYSYKQSEKAILPGDDVIRAQFAGALRLKLEGIAVPDRALRAPEVAAAVTLPEKLAAYRKEETLPPSVAAKLDALLTQAPADVLADVTTTLAEIERPQERSTEAA